MLMHTLTNEVIRRIVYNPSPEVDLAEQDVAQLNALAVEDAIPILRTIFEHERAPNAQSRAFDRVQFLLNLLDLSSNGWRGASCHSLAHFPDPRARAALCPMLLHDPDPHIRSTAAESLAVIGDTMTIAALERTQATDTGTDGEGFRIADAARNALQEIRGRMDP